MVPKELKASVRGSPLDHRGDRLTHSSGLYILYTYTMVHQVHVDEFQIPHVRAAD